MKRFYQIIITTGILSMFLATGCIQENLEPCPEATVTVNLRAETFGKENIGPVSIYEAEFGKRIGSLHYSLYDNGKLIWEKQESNLTGATTPVYDLNLGNLEMGNYELLVTANVPASHYENSAASHDVYAIKYQDPYLTEDYFSCVIPVIVDCNCDLSFDGTLRRLHTVVRCTMYDVPDNIAAAEITVNNLSERKYLSGDYYDGITEAAYRKDIEDSRRESFVMVVGSFPTAENGKTSAFGLKLFDNAGNTVYEKTVTSDLILKRNTLTDVIVRFPENSNGDISYEINMNTSWEGHTDGGSTEVE